MLLRLLRWLILLPFSLCSTILTHLKVVVLFLSASHGGNTHAERINNYFKSHAPIYDQSRKYFLIGREESVTKAVNVVLRSSEDKSEGQFVWLDIGGGTASSLEYITEEELKRFKRIFIVDLAAPLLRVAKDKIAQNGWKNVTLIEGDITTFTSEHEDLQHGKVDLVTISYALSMIPNWFEAIDVAKKYLKPESGVISACDYYISRKFSSSYTLYDEKTLRPLSTNNQFVVHSWLVRTILPVINDSNNVNSSKDIVPYFAHHFKTIHLKEANVLLPYFLPLIPSPYYVYIGKK